jgi:hypothetical protein
MNERKITSFEGGSTSKADDVMDQIADYRREFDFELRDYPVDFLVELYGSGLICSPMDRRRLGYWDDRRGSRFIESLLIGYPTPNMVFYGADDGRAEIVDGARRMGALEEFVNGDLTLRDLPKLTELNGLTFQELPPSARRNFLKTTLRTIDLNRKTSPEAKEEICRRINSSATALHLPKAKRRVFEGELADFLYDRSKRPLFQKLCPVGESSRKRNEDLELLLRFFAYVNDFESILDDVDYFLDGFMERRQNDFDEEVFAGQLESMLSFVFKHFPNGFRRSPADRFVASTRFEAIAVGAALALRENPKLTPAVKLSWSDVASPEGERFKRLSSMKARDDKNRLKERAAYVKNMLLYGEEQPEAASPRRRQRS